MDNLEIPTQDTSETILLHRLRSYVGFARKTVGIGCVAVSSTLGLLAVIQNQSVAFYWVDDLLSDQSTPENFGQGIVQLDPSLSYSLSLSPDEYCLALVCDTGVQYIWLPALTTGALAVLARYTTSPSKDSTIKSFEWWPVKQGTDGEDGPAYRTIRYLQSDGVVVQDTLGQLSQRIECSTAVDAMSLCKDTSLGVRWAYSSGNCVQVMFDSEDNAFEAEVELREGGDSNILGMCFKSAQQILVTCLENEEVVLLMIQLTDQFGVFAIHEVEFPFSSMENPQDYNWLNSAQQVTLPTLSDHTSVTFVSDVRLDSEQVRIVQGSEQGVGVMVLEDEDVLLGVLEQYAQLNGIACIYSAHTHTFPHPQEDHPDLPPGPILVTTDSLGNLTLTHINHYNIDLSPLLQPPTPASQDLATLPSYLAQAAPIAEQDEPPTTADISQDATAAATMQLPSDESDFESEEEGEHGSAGDSGDSADYEGSNRSSDGSNRSSGTDNSGWQIVGNAPSTAISQPTKPQTQQDRAAQPQQTGWSNDSEISLAPMTVSRPHSNLFGSTTSGKVDAPAGGLSIPKAPDFNVPLGARFGGGAKPLGVASTSQSIEQSTSSVFGIPGSGMQQGEPWQARRVSSTDGQNQRAQGDYEDDDDSVKLPCPPGAAEQGDGSEASSTGVVGGMGKETFEQVKQLLANTPSQDKDQILSIIQQFVVGSEGEERRGEAGKPFGREVQVALSGRSEQTRGKQGDIVRVKQAEMLGKLMKEAQEKVKDVTGKLKSMRVEAPRHTGPAALSGYTLQLADLLPGDAQHVTDLEKRMVESINEGGDYVAGVSGLAKVWAQYCQGVQAGVDESIAKLRAVRDEMQQQLSKEAQRVDPILYRSLDLHDQCIAMDLKLNNMYLNEKRDTREHNIARQYRQQINELKYKLANINVQQECVTDILASFGQGHVLADRLVQSSAMKRHSEFVVLTQQEVAQAQEGGLMQGAGGGGGGGAAHVFDRLDSVQQEYELLKEQVEGTMDRIRALSIDQAAHENPSPPQFLRPSQTPPVLYNPSNHQPQYPHDQPVQLHVPLMSGSVEWAPHIDPRLTRLLTKHLKPPNRQPTSAQQDSTSTRGVRGHALWDTDGGKAYAAALAVWSRQAFGDPKDGVGEGGKGVSEMDGNIAHLFDDENVKRGVPDGQARVHFATDKAKVDVQDCTVGGVFSKQYQEYVKGREEGLRDAGGGSAQGSDGRPSQPQVLPWTPVAKQPLTVGPPQQPSQAEIKLNAIRQSAVGAGAGVRVSKGGLAIRQAQTSSRAAVSGAAQPIRQPEKGGAASTQSAMFNASKLGAGGVGSVVGSGIGAGNVGKPAQVKGLVANQSKPAGAPRTPAAGGGSGLPGIPSKSAQAAVFKLQAQDQSKQQPPRATTGGVSSTGNTQQPATRATGVTPSASTKPPSAPAAAPSGLPGIPSKSLQQKVMASQAQDLSSSQATSKPTAPTTTAGAASASTAGTAVAGLASTFAGAVSGGGVSIGAGASSSGTLFGSKGTGVFGQQSSAAAGQSATTASTPAFGGGAGGLFGASTGAGTGASTGGVFGSSGSAGSVFGGSSGGSVFGGAASSSSVFGASSAAAFGSSGAGVFGAASGGSVLGASSQSQATGGASPFGVFGSSASSTPAFGGAFGASSASAFGMSSAAAFGGASQSSSAFGMGAFGSTLGAFGQQSSAQATGGFGQPPQLGGAAPATPAFGGFGQTPAIGGAFGQTPTVGGAFGGGAFGQSPGNQISSGFGQPAVLGGGFGAQAGAFGQQQGSAFGQPAQQSSQSAFGAFSNTASFGATSSFGGSGGGFAQVAQGASAFGNVAGSAMSSFQPNPELADLQPRR